MTPSCRDADGYFYYQARSDDMIISSGYNIAGPEVEEALLRHPDVAECAVVGAPDAERGQSSRRSSCCATGVAGDAAKAEELQDFVKAADRAVQVPAASSSSCAAAAASTPDRQAAALQAARSSARPGPRRLMRIAVVGGGPGGLYFAALAKQLDPRHEITVWERNAADDTFGFGVVFSDETLGGIEHADPAIYAAMEREFARWDDIDVALPRRRCITSGGHGFAAMSRKRLLEILQERCRELGVDVHFRTEAPDVDELRATLRPRRRRRRRQLADPGDVRRHASGPTLDVRHAASTCGSAPTRSSTRSSSTSRETPYGVMQIHGYPYDADGSTFIVEMHEDGLAARPASTRRRRTFAPGESRRGVDRAGRASSSPTSSTATPVLANNSQVDQLHDRAQRALAARQRRAARRRRAHRALLDRLRHQARHGGRARAGRLPARAARRRRRRWPRTRPSAGRSCCRPSARRRRAWSGSRTSASTCDQEPAAVRVQHA